MTAAGRLAELGLTLPSVVAPAGSYVPAVRTGQFVYTAGQLPVVDGKLPATGKVGAEVSPSDAAGLRPPGPVDYGLAHAEMGVRDGAAAGARHQADPRQLG